MYLIFTHASAGVYKSSPTHALHVVMGRPVVIMLGETLCTVRVPSIGSVLNLFGVLVRKVY